MEEDKIKVYIQLDSNNIITRIESDISCIDFTNAWTQIDEGMGDKYAHAQSNYLDKSLVDYDGRYNYKYINNTVIELTDSEKISLDEVKKNKISELSDACNNAIINGFYSSADGTNKLYDFELENQVNIVTKANQIQVSQLANQTVSNISYYAKGGDCHDYTPAQFLQLAQDGASWKTQCITKYKDILKPKVVACTTVDQVNVITWDADTSSSNTVSANTTQGSGSSATS